MAKLTRESRLRERRQDKQAKKNARKLAAASGTSEAEETLTEDPLADTPLAEDTLTGAPHADA
ncbi:MAG: hypothetical protein M3071_13900 [Actinomycetota bacterium]|nr:hypothetical protein [Actinomycetota bacterium]